MSFIDDNGHRRLAIEGAPDQVRNQRTDHDARAERLTRAHDDRGVPLGIDPAQAARAAGWIEGQPSTQGRSGPDPRHLPPMSAEEVVEVSVPRDPSPMVFTARKPLREDEPVPPSHVPDPAQAARYEAAKQRDPWETLLAQLELGASAVPTASRWSSFTVDVSIAISLKRIADAVCRPSPSLDEVRAQIDAQLQRHEPPTTQPFTCAYCTERNIVVSGQHSHVCSDCGRHAIGGWYTRPWCEAHRPTG